MSRLAVPIVLAALAAACSEDSNLEAPGAPTPMAGPAALAVDGGRAAPAGAGSAPLLPLTAAGGMDLAPGGGGGAPVPRLQPALL